MKKRVERERESGRWCHRKEQMFAKLNWTIIERDTDSGERKGGGTEAETRWQLDEWKHKGEGPHVDACSDISAVKSGDIYQRHLA